MNEYEIKIIELLNKEDIIQYTVHRIKIISFEKKKVVKFSNWVTIYYEYGEYAELARDERGEDINYVCDRARRLNKIN